MDPLQWSNAERHRLGMGNHDRRQYWQPPGQHRPQVQPRPAMRPVPVPVMAAPQDPFDFLQEQLNEQAVDDLPRQDPASSSISSGTVVPHY